MANILIDLGHPAHVHLFHHAARRWMAEGHQVLFSALDREMIIYLLEHYDLPYEITYKRRKGKLALLLELPIRAYATYRIARRFRADLLVSFGNPTVGFPAFLLRKPYLALTDTDHATEQHLLFKPFATRIATPIVFTRDLGPKQIRYAGMHELAYLHPDEFTPDRSILKSLGLQENETFFVVRFVAWGATHDVGHRGFSSTEKRDLLRELSQYGRVLLSVEGDIDEEFAPLVTHFPPEHIHHLLAFAKMYVGEGGTMASEAAILGTPSIFVSTLWAGVWDDLRDRYGLLFSANSGSEALKLARDILNMPDSKQEWLHRRDKMLEEKINPTRWLVEVGNRLLHGEV